MTLPLPSPTTPFGPDATIHMGVWCSKKQGELMDCERDCDKCEWKYQQVLNL
jgi:hypothetical protein